MSCLAWRRFYVQASSSLLGDREKRVGKSIFRSEYSQRKGQPTRPMPAELDQVLGTRPFLSVFVFFHLICLTKRTERSIRGVGGNVDLLPGARDVLTRPLSSSGARPGRPRLAGIREGEEEAFVPGDQSVIPSISRHLALGSAIEASAESTRQSQSHAEPSIPPAPISTRPA